MNSNDEMLRAAKVVIDDLVDWINSDLYGAMQENASWGYDRYTVPFSNLKTSLANASKWLEIFEGNGNQRPLNSKEK